MASPVVWVLIIMVGVSASPVIVEFTDGFRCATARDAIRGSTVGPLTYVECFPK
jgi:hypothetical protein